MQPTIEQLFDSPVKLRLLKFFLRNSEAFFETKEVAKKIGVPRSRLKRPLLKLKEIEFLISKKAKSGKISFTLNKEFLFYPELKNLILKSIPVPFEELKERIIGIGDIKLVIISGILLNEKGSRLDILIVGERIDQKKLNNLIKKLEQNIGKEIVYAVFTPKEFRYRLDVRDKFVRDVLEGKHEKLVQKIKI